MAQIVKHSFPADYDPDDTLALELPKALIPIVAGLLAQLEWRANWRTQADWEEGLQAAYLLQERVLN